MSHGKLLGIAIRSRSRAEMTQLQSAEITIAEGVVGDFRGRPGRRQVTILSREAWDHASSNLNQSLPWTTRRANLLVEGVELKESTGARITIGQVVLEVCGETDPCQRMEEQVRGLYQELLPDWRGGVCCRVVQGGTVQVGDGVQLDVH